MIYIPALKRFKKLKNCETRKWLPSKGSISLNLLNGDAIQKQIKESGSSLSHN